ncbi:MAG TPA: GNAT family N-acetyltransferase, partial [Steroidobacteraceae bacterium]|nr:GNAT family N-acetyltransferase [Steroidobacteraceae bacterium]
MIAAVKSMIAPLFIMMQGRLEALKIITRESENESAMTELPERLFLNPVWHALHTKHRHLAVCAGDACRYPADAAPFAAVAAPSASALQQLHSLLAAGESAWLIGDNLPRVPSLSLGKTMDCLQMVLPAQVGLPPSDSDAVRLSAADAPQMLSLAELAFPGFFRRRTGEMGSYYGIRSGGALIAMAGERLMIEGYPEISGVCTHPAHRGRGHAAKLIAQLAQDHRRDGLVSWLHVGCEN